MKAVLTRVSSASVTVDGEVTGEIENGILALIGVGVEDVNRSEAIETMVRKIAELRMLDEEKSASEVHAPILVVSQFTLQGKTAKGRRPSWINAAKAEEAEPIINEIVARLRQRGLQVEEGKFGAMMQVASVNEGPFTLLVET